MLKANLEMNMTKHKKDDKKKNILAIDLGIQVESSSDVIENIVFFVM